MNSKARVRKWQRKMNIYWVPCFYSVAKPCPPFCYPTNCSTPGSLSSTISRSLLHSCPLSWWCQPTISSSVVPFSPCPQSFPASGSFPMSQLFTSGDQSIGPSSSASAEYSFLPVNIQGWSLGLSLAHPLGWTGWISLHPFDSHESSPAPQFESIILRCSAFVCTECLLCVLNTFYLIRIRTLWDRNHDLHFIDGETDLDRSQAGYTTCQLRTAFVFCLSHCNEDSALCAPFTCDTYFTHHFLYF